MAKKKPKIQIRLNGGNAEWLTQRQIINRIKKGFDVNTTKRSANYDVIPLIEKYTPNIEPTEVQFEERKGGKTKKPQKLKATISEALETVKEKEKKNQKEYFRGRKRELIKESILNIPVSSVTSRFADSDGQFNRLVEKGKLKVYPPSEFKIIDLDGKIFETKNRLDFVNFFMDQTEILYNVVTLILENDEDKHKISSPQFFVDGYFLLQYNFIIVGALADFTKIDIKGMHVELFKIYYELYKQIYNNE